MVDKIFLDDKWVEVTDRRAIKIEVTEAFKLKDGTEREIITTHFPQKEKK